ncbi:hypothetical protein [Arthrobacter sp. RCC_34]|uniref:hypothetical protein n=1 Tax=Arthrobacter sp. RCC_34 TaxID=3239230 RepID=UPI0035245F64
MAPRTWLSIDGLHAGDVVGILEDGTATLPLTEQAVMVQLPSGLQLVDDDEVTGWTVVCSCTSSWDAPRWARNFDGGQADPERRVDGLRAGHPCNPSVTVAEALWKAWKAHSDREVAVTELHAARRAHEETARRLANAVAASRAIELQLSWAEIGSAVGTSKQAAHERWGRVKTGAGQ